jgi:hypothetical protein
MSKVAQVKAGLEASVATRRKITDAEKQRWQSVLANVPERRQKMAMTLLGDPRASSMSVEEIVTTCNVGVTQSAGESQSGQQKLYEAGMRESAALLGRPKDFDVPTVFTDAPQPQFDQAAVARGEAMAKGLKRFMGRSIERERFA